MRAGPFLLVNMALLLACSPSAQQVSRSTDSAASALGQQEKKAMSTDTNLNEAKVNAALAKADQLQHLNAFIHVATEQALTQARQLDASSGERVIPGWTLAIKDNIHVAGMPNTAGTEALKKFVPAQDSPVIARLRAAGAIVLGKANMHELAFGITSDNASFGPVRNPVNPELFAGGSSGGTAAAIAAGIVDAGLGTDTGGSVRIPAALTGIVGFRPTTGRYPVQGVTPVSHTRDTIGPMARTVDQIIALDTAITGDATLPEIQLATLRLGIDRDYFFANLDPETAAITEQALERLQAAGVTLIEHNASELSALLTDSAFPIALYEATRDLDRYLVEHDTNVSLEQLMAGVTSPDVQGIFAAATAEESAIPEAAYQQALKARQVLQQLFERYFSENQLAGIIFPTTALPARPIEGSLDAVTLNGEAVPTFPTYIRNTDPASIAALPGISIPAGSTASGLPVGLEIDAPASSDRKLLAIARAVETTLAGEL